MSDWIHEACKEYASEFSPAPHSELRIILQKHHAAHIATCDTDKLAERITEYAVAATHVYAMQSRSPEHLQRLKEREESKKQEMMPHIAELLAPILARIAAMEAVLREAPTELAKYRRTFAKIEEILKADDSREIEFGISYATLTRHHSATNEVCVEECGTPFAALSALADSIIREELERKDSTL